MLKKNKKMRKQRQRKTYYVKQAVKHAKLSKQYEKHWFNTEKTNAATENKITIEKQHKRRKTTRKVTISAEILNKQIAKKQHSTAEKI